MDAYQLLERQWAEFNNLDPEGMVVCASGTAALHLSLESMRLAPEGEVATANYNMIAVPRAITLAGLKPAFMDCNSSLLINPVHLRDWFHLRRKAFNPVAIIAVHVYGRRCDMKSIDYLTTLGELKVIEDLSEAHGLRPYQNTDAACWSFYRNKIVGGEEGGAVWFRSVAHARLARSLRTLGFTDKHNYYHIPRGHNYRLSNLHAQAVLNSLDSYEQNIKWRAVCANIYQQECPKEWQQPPRAFNWVWDFRIPGITAEKQTRIIEVVQALGVAARYGFKPMTSQEEYQYHYSIDAGHSLTASREVVYLPFTKDMTPYGAKFIFDTVRDVCQST